MASSHDYARKIAGLLAKAEDDACTPEEAETFLAKAQEWCTKYSIDEALLAATRGDDKAAEKIVMEAFEHKGTMRDGTVMITFTIASENGCRSVQRKLSKRDYMLDVVGFEGDVARTKMLDASLQVQAQTALLAFNHENRDRLGCLSSSERHREKRQFLVCFSAGLKEQLARARKAVVAQATEAPGGESVALVLRSKDQRVGDWVDETYGRLCHSTGHKYGGSLSASAAGRQAGQRADASCGSGRMPSAARGALGR